MAINKYLSIIILTVKGLNAPIKKPRIAEWIRKQDPALAGWYSCLEHHPVHQKVAGLIPSWSTY